MTILGFAWTPSFKSFLAFHRTLLTDTFRYWPQVR